MLSSSAAARGGTLVEILAAVTFAFTLHGCDLMPTSGVISRGEFEGITIGIPKQEILDILRDREVSQVNIRDSGQIVIRDPQRLSELSDVEKLVVSDYAATGLTLEFAGDELVWSILSENIPVDLRPALSKGAGRDDAFAAIKMLMNENRKIVAFSSIPDVTSTYVNINTPTEAEFALLQTYDIWSYTIYTQRRFPTQVLLYFKGDHLERIEYKEFWGY